MTPGELILKNAKIVTPAEVVEGAVHVREGAITDINAGPLESAAPVDIEGTICFRA